MTVADEGAGVRTRYGVIALTAGNEKVALVRLSDTGAWQFPSVLPTREGDQLVEQLEAALSVAQQQLGLDVTEMLCSQPVIHALGPEPRVSTKFFMAFNVPEVPLVPADEALAAQGAQAASWEDLQGLLEETAGQPVAGNQLVAVLRQLQSMAKRRYEMIMPSDDGYQEVAELMSWHETEAASWQGAKPKDFLEEHCRSNKLPAPCFNVFERDRTATRTHFCATCLLPHLGIQLTPDAVYPSPVDALENAAVLAVLYLEGALAPGCPLVHFAPAGDMAQVPHAFVTEHEVKLDSRAVQGEADRHKRELERQVQREQAALQRRLDELKRQQQMLAAGDIPGLQQQQQQASQQQQQHAGGGGGGSGGPAAAAQAAAAAAVAVADRAAKRAKVDKSALTVAQALQQIPVAKNSLMAVKELCDKCRFPLPAYDETKAADGRTVVAATLPQAGLDRITGAPHEDKRQARVLAAQALLDALRKKHPAA